MNEEKIDARRRAARQKIRGLLEALSDAERDLLRRVLEFERENLHYKRPPAVKQVLLDMVEEEIQ